MSKYRIIIGPCSNFYVQILQKRVFFFKWKRVTVQSSSLPIPETVLSWQKEYNIPDKNVKMYL